MFKLETKEQKLMRYIDDDHLVKVQSLFAKYSMSRELVNFKDSFGDTALLKATKRRSFQLVSYLIDARADLDVPDNVRFYSNCCFLRHPYFWFVF